MLRLPPAGVVWLVPEETGGPVHPRRPVRSAATEPAVEPPPAGAAHAPDLARGVTPAPEIGPADDDSRDV